MVVFKVSQYLARWGWTLLIQSNVIRSRRPDKARRMLILLVTRSLKFAGVLEAHRYVSESSIATLDTLHRLADSFGLKRDRLFIIHDVLNSIKLWWTLFICILTWLHRRCSIKFVMDAPLFLHTWRRLRELQNKRLTARARFTLLLTELLLLRQALLAILLPLLFVSHRDRVLKANRHIATCKLMIIQQPLLTFHYELVISDLVHLLVTAAHFTATLVAMDFSHLKPAKTGELGLACLVDYCIFVLCCLILKGAFGFLKCLSCFDIIALWPVFDLLILFQRIDRLTWRLLLLFCR